MDTPGAVYLRRISRRNENGQPENPYQAEGLRAQPDRSVLRADRGNREADGREGIGPHSTEKEIVTILRAPHKYKDSREQFEMRTHKRLIDIHNPNPRTVDAMMKLDLPAGVEIEIKLNN